MTALDAALAHAQAGRLIFPCKADKRPLTAHGFKDATKDPARIADAWKRHPSALIGLPTGLPNRVFVIDIDVDEAAGKDGEASLAALIARHGTIPHTVEALTPRGGRHLYFRHPGPEWEVPSSVGDLGPAIDVRGDGGYVIVPPSRLPDGRCYGWEGSSDPDEGAPVAPAPAWLLALVARRQGQPARPPASRPEGSPEIPQGGRNDTLFRLGRSLRAKHLSENAILASLREVNAERCTPPLDEAELQGIAAKVCTVPPGPSSDRKGASTAAPPWPDIQMGDESRGYVWPDPLDLAAAVDPEPYPTHCLPPVARAAVVEYQAFGQQPISLVGMAALAQMSLAAQGLADVARNAHLVSPISLNLMAMAVSGERKTAADKIFGKAARDWQSRAREERLPDYRRASAMHKDWLSRIDGVKKRITTLAGKDPQGADQEELARLRDRLIELEQNPIIARPLPLLHFEDITPGGLQHGLATGWPSAGLFSDEGGAVIGGHGMGDDTAVSLLSLLNILWDGRDYIPTRKTAAAAELRGRRFSAFLMVQPDLLGKLLDKGARNIGFIARFLVAHPTSTMGTRLYQEPPAGWQAMPAFDRAITALLETELPVDATGNDRGLQMRLAPPVMALSPAAKRLFVDYHDQVETELRQFGDLEGVRDVASKSAENACRIAAVCQIFDQGRPAPEVDESYVRAGIGLAAWHLTEARRLFLEVDAPQDVSDARELAVWLTGRGRELADSNGIPVIGHDGTIATRDILQRGPNRVRDTERRAAALKALEEANYVLQVTEGRKKLVRINPKLLEIQRSAKYSNV